jgi:prolyl 4-hydroxylase
MARGGQRIWSIMVYLNEVEEGGGTAFPELEIEVIPERGKLLAWNNVTEQGLNYDSLHIGLPVE